VDPREHTKVIDMSVLCSCLRETFPDLNLEGGVVDGDEFVLVQRGNKGARRNALVFVALDDLQRALASQRFEVTRAPRIVDLDLGMHGPVPWACTDLAVLDDGDLLACAVLEDTGDAYQDGGFLGSALVRMARHGALRWHRRLATAPKVEGIAVDGDTVWLVSDADDRDVPSAAAARHVVLRRTLLCRRLRHRAWLIDSPSRTRAAVGRCSANEHVPSPASLIDQEPRCGRTLFDTWRDSGHGLSCRHGT
jgi:hypothetical protein